MLRDNALAHANIVAHNESQHPAPITFAFSTAISFTFHVANLIFALCFSFCKPEHRSFTIAIVVTLAHTK
jgi:hypothetical protein